MKTYAFPLMIGIVITGGMSVLKVRNPFNEIYISILNLYSYKILFFKTMSRNINILLKIIIK